VTTTAPGRLDLKDLPEVYAAWHDYIPASPRISADEQRNHLEAANWSLVPLFTA